jgi:hypothetical protein
MTTSLDGDQRGAMVASKGRVPMTMLSLFDGRRLWLVSFVSIVAILAVNYIVSGPAHVGSPIVVRLAAAAIVTAFVAVAKFVAGPRAAVVTAVVGVLIAVVVLRQAAWRSNSRGLDRVMRRANDIGFGRVWVTSCGDSAKTVVVDPLRTRSRPRWAT